MESIGNYLRKLRLDKGDTVQAVASYLDIEPELLSRIEKRQANPTKIQAVKFASYFGIAEKEMLTIFQRSRIASELGDNGISASGVRLGKAISGLIKDREKALRRHQNMTYELVQLVNGRIDVRFYKPSAPLDLYIESMVYYTSYSMDYTHEKLLPDGVVQLFIKLNDTEKVSQFSDGEHHNQSMKATWITGIQKQHLTYPFELSAATLCIRFRPGGFYMATHIPQSDLEDTCLPASLIFGRSISDLQEQMMHCFHVPDVFRLAEQYFLDRIYPENTEHAIIRYMCRNMDVPLSTLVQKTGYSQKHLIHLFKKHIGLTPKYFQRLYRFNKVLNDLQAVPHALDWQNIVFNNHYYDQAHFIKEFTYFSGISPQSYMEAGGTCPKFVHIRRHR